MAGGGEGGKEKDQVKRKEEKGGEMQRKRRKQILCERARGRRGGEGRWVKVGSIKQHPFGKIRGKREGETGERGAW